MIKAMAPKSMITPLDISHTGKGQHIGYWTTSRVNDPFPLPWPGDFVDPDWDSQEAEAVAQYLDSQPDVQHWRGISFCRLDCGYTAMGSTDKSDGIYTWPAGFSHYIRDHKVKPPQEFIDHCLGRAKQTKVAHPKDRLPAIYPLPDWVVVGAQIRANHLSNLVPPGTEATVHSFAEDRVNIEVGEGEFYNYLRGDFIGLFEQVSKNTSVKPAQRGYKGWGATR